MIFRSIFINLFSHTHVVMYVPLNPRDETSSTRDIKILMCDSHSPLYLILLFSVASTYVLIYCAVVIYHGLKWISFWLTKYCSITENNSWLLILISPEEKKTFIFIYLIYNKNDKLTTINNMEMKWKSQDITLA